MVDKALLAGVPRIRRARGFRLYDGSGRRYLDLYRDGALLGHRTGLTAMKAALSQGLAAGLPSAWEARLAAAIARALPAYPVVRLYASAERALEAVSRCLGVAASPHEVLDPALLPADEQVSGVSLWRPFLPAVRGATAVFPVLPLTVCGCPAPVCFPAEALPEAPSSDTLPGFLCAAALKGLASLGGAEALLPDPDVARRLQSAAGWRLRGPYVSAVFPAEEYPRVFAEFLAAGVLLYPGHPGPSVLPGECSPGESKLLADLFAGIPGG